MPVTLSSVFADCAHIIPEIILVITLCAVILADVVLPRSRSGQTGFITLAGLTLAFFSIAFSYGNKSIFSMTAEAASSGPVYAFSRMLVVDKLSDFFKIIFILGTAAVVLLSLKSEELRNYRMGEYYTLILGTLLGGAFLVSSNNFLMLVLSLETLSLCSYVLAGYQKHDRLSAEASLKYILYGSVASGVMLFGISYIYGLAGTLDVRDALVGIPMREDNAMAVLLSFILVIGGLGFKMAVVPFHFWCPDVYQGAPTPITAFLAVVSKAAGFSALFRVLLPLFAIQNGAIPETLVAVRAPLLSLINLGHLPLLFWILSVATMTLGNLVAIRQTNLKRLLAYSSIAHAGYILMGMTVFNSASMEAMLLYFFVYLFMNIGAFAVVIVMMNKTGSAELSAYKGMIYKNPWLTISMFIFLISLTGIPPTAGFIGKLRLFGAVVARARTHGIRDFMARQSFTIRSSSLAESIRLSRFSIT